MYRDDLQASSAELLYGTNITVPGDLVVANKFVPEIEFVRKLKSFMSELRPTPTSHHTKSKIFVHKDLNNCTHVFVRNDTVKTPLQPSYDGPFEVVKRYDKYFIIKFKNRETSISLDRLKPAFLLNNLLEPTFTDRVEQSGQLEENNLTHFSNIKLPKNTDILTNVDIPSTTTTKSGRRVRFPKRFLD